MSKSRKRCPQPASFLKTSNGGLLSTLLLLKRPIVNTIAVIPGSRTKNGTSEGIKVALNTKIDNSKLANSDSKMPIPVPLSLTPF